MSYLRQLTNDLLEGKLDKDGGMPAEKTPSAEGKKASPTVACPICYCDFPADEMVYTPCCQKGPFCKECFEGSLRSITEECKCMQCQDLVDPVLYHAYVADEEIRLKIAKIWGRAKGGWIN